MTALETAVSAAAASPGQGVPDSRSASHFVPWGGKWGRLGESKSRECKHEEMSLLALVTHASVPTALLGTVCKGSRDPGDLAQAESPQLALAETPGKLPL